jgi:uncharacterized OB-fold protein
MQLDGKFSEHEPEITAIRELHEESLGIFRYLHSDIIEQMRKGQKVRGRERIVDDVYSCTFRKRCG